MAFLGVLSFMGHVIDDIRTYLRTYTISHYNNNTGNCYSYDMGWCRLIFDSIYCEGSPSYVPGALLLRLT